MTQVLDPDMQDAWDELEKEHEDLLRVARAFQDVKNYYTNSAIPSDGVFNQPYFKDGMRHAYSVLKEVEHLL